jgi:hypothetical protein
LPSQIRILNSFDKLLKLSLNFNTLFGTTIRILYINIILHQNGDFSSVYCDYGNIINKAKKFKMTLSAIFQLYHGNQFWWWKKPEYLERTTDHGQATKLYHLPLRVECTLFCNLQSRARIHAVLVIGLYDLLGNSTT